MIKVVSKRMFKQEHEEKALELYKKLTDYSRKEEGCISYDLFRDCENSLIFCVIEEWESNDVLKAHFKSDHFREIIPQIRELSDGEAELNIYTQAY